MDIDMDTRCRGISGIVRRVLGLKSNSKFGMRGQLVAGDDPNFTVLYPGWKSVKDEDRKGCWMYRYNGVDYLIRVAKQSVSIKGSDGMIFSANNMLVTSKDIPVMLVKQKWHKIGNKWEKVPAAAETVIKQEAMIAPIQSRQEV